MHSYLKDRKSATRNRSASAILIRLFSLPAKADVRLNRSSPCVYPANDYTNLIGKPLKLRVWCFRRTGKASGGDGLQPEKC